MASNFYKNFKVKKSENLQVPLTSDRDFLTLPIGTIIINNGGDEFVKVQNNVYDKSEKIILTKNEVADTYATKTELQNKVQVVSNIDQATTNNVLYLVLA